MSVPVDERPVMGEIARPSQPELWLLKFLLLADDDQLAWAAAHLDGTWIAHETVRHVVGLRLAMAGTDRSGELGPLLDQLEDDPFAAQLVTEAAMEARAIEDLRTQLMEATLRLRNLWIERQLSVLMGQLSDPSLPEEQRHAVLRRQLELRAWKKTPLAELGGF